MAASGAGCEAVVFFGYFEDLPDPRQRGKVMYRLDEVLLLSLLAVLAGAETFVDIARFGAKKLSLLRKRWLGKFAHLLKWNFCLNSAMMPENRREDDEAYPP